MADRRGQSRGGRAGGRGVRGQPTAQRGGPRPGPPPTAVAPPGKPQELLQEARKPVGPSAGSAPPTAGHSFARGISPGASVSSVAQSVAAMSLASGEPSVRVPADAAARGSAEPSRGSCRTRALERGEGPIVTKPASLASKQGAYGAPAKFQANYFRLRPGTEWTLYKYRVDFLPEEDRKVIKKALVRSHRELFGTSYICDGDMIFTRVRLETPLELVSQRTSDNVTVQITIKLVGSLGPGHAEVTQTENNVIRKCLDSLNLQLVGRDFYDPAAKVTLAAHRLEIWPGYLTSFLQCEEDVLLNVDISSKVMRLDTALDLIRSCRERDGRNWQKTFTAAIVGTTVITRYNNKTYKVDDVDFTASPASTFDQRGAAISYIQYYNERYQLRIQERDQPLLVSLPKEKDKRGGRSNLILLIPELCCLTGITDEMRNNFTLMRDMAEHTRIRPQVRMQRLEQGFMQRLLATEITRNELNNWNLQLEPNFVSVPGRIFPAESLVHGRGRTSKVDQETAEFTRNLRGQEMLSQATVNSWLLVFPRRVGGQVNGYVQTLVQAGRSLGFHLPEPIYEEINDDRGGTYALAIEHHLSQNGNINLVMCIAPNNKADRYEAIKRKCCVERAVPSQVILAKNMTHKNVVSIASKVAIQLNCKLGGEPWAVTFPTMKGVMMVGYDVCRDTRDKSRTFGALVATTNDTYSRYFSTVSHHCGGEELSDQISLMMQQAVQRYKDINKEVPKRILFYRDGVGDGDLRYVVEHEVQHIRSGLKSFYPNENDLMLCFTIVSKRTNTRIFNNRNNPPPGSIVDSVITIPTKYDFFLVSQSVKQGTVAPTHYNTIYDTSQFKPDQLQRITYKMTHLYYNWSGTVRVPAPVQYAHKLAFLVAQAIHRPPDVRLQDVLYFL